MASDIATTQSEYAHIVHTPGLVGGEARIDGQRIRVRDVAAARDLGGMTPEEIAATAYPSLTMAQVYAALAYYEDHRDEIDRATSDEASFLDRFRSEHPELIRESALPKR